nr:hypothetical protein CTI12_AA233370 [Tanacetum cinerariifolium]
MVKGRNLKETELMGRDIELGFDEHFTKESPFDIGAKNEVAMNLNGSYDHKLVTIVCQEFMRMFKGKDITSEGNAGPSYAGIWSCSTASLALFNHPNMKIRLDWVNDTGASDHMIPNFSLFITVINFKNLIMVHLPNGSSKTMTIVWSVKPTPTLILTNVFYVPDFQLNLLSVGKLSQNNQLVAYFYPDDFCFQDLSTDQIVVVGKGSSSDHLGMVLTTTPFNGSNFNGWSKNVRMDFGAKLKLGFINGSCVKPDVGDAELQRWIRCDCMEIAESLLQNPQLLTSSMANTSSSNPNRNNNSNLNQNQNLNQNLLNANMINDPLYIASSDHLGMVLTTTPFNGSNFNGWSKNVRMAFGAKLKLGFINGSRVKPDVGDAELQRWIRCDCMVTC